MAKKKEKPDEVAQIYETIKGKDFIQDLWLDALSDINKKPSYARLKSMVSKVIKSEVDNYAPLPENDEERLQTRTLFSRLSIMTYTIDTLISEILYKKLNGEIKSIIGNILDELRSNLQEGNESAQEVDDSVNALEGIGEILCNGGTEEHANPINEAKSKLKFITEDQENHYKRNHALSDNENSDVDIMNASEDDDSFSIDGNSSFRSDVSSVHTSDLSSFEDNISISSEDDDGVKVKKIIPLKFAKDMCANSELPTSAKRKTKKTKSSPSISSSPPSPPKPDDIPSKRLPARTRKLNSKYSNDNVICPIKPLLSQGEVSRNSLRIDEYEEEDSKPKKSPPKRKRQAKVPYDIERVNKILGISPKRASFTIVKQSPNHKIMRGQENQYNSVQISQTTKNIPNEIQNQKPANIPVTATSHIVDEGNVKRGRGRPPKQPRKKSSDEEHSPVKIEKKSDEEGVSGMKRKRGRPSKLAGQETSGKDTTENNDNGEQAKHSVESFSFLEEQLCLKDKKISPNNSPSKSSTKRYEKSDLYKPHSDFRLSLKSGGSKALTLFSN